MVKMMVDGTWRGDVADTPELRACRVATGSFRGGVTAAEANEPSRFHLYVSYSCPFAHRTILARALLGLHDRVGLSVVHPTWNTPHGWVFGDTALSTPDRGGNDWTHLHQAYSASDPGYTGKVLVPVLWDRSKGRIISNESADIVRLFGQVFAAGSGVDLYPAPLRTEIDALNTTIGRELGAGVYAVASAADQAEYDRIVDRVFAVLDAIEARLADGRPFLHGTGLTESDLVLFTPVARFDIVYHPLFRVSRRRIADYPALSAWARRVFSIPGVAGTVRFEAILRHYYDGDWAVTNRTDIVPALPDPFFLTAA